MSALDTQVGGDHYKLAKIQPVQYIEANKMGFLEGCVVKRLTRHDKPTGKGRQDIEKAIHELQLLLELRYPVVKATESINSGRVIHGDVVVGGEIKPTACTLQCKWDQIVRINPLEPLLKEKCLTCGSVRDIAQAHGI